MTASGSASYRWQHVPGQELVLLAGDLVRARYHFATDRREGFVHPLQTADGILMTATEPWDHAWHRGLWFRWKYVNGVNYWEELERIIASDEDTRAKTAAWIGECGSIELVGTELVELRDEQAVVRTSYRYRADGADAGLEEERIGTIHLPDAEGNIRLVAHVRCRRRPGGDRPDAGHI